MADNVWQFASIHVPDLDKTGATYMAVLCRSDVNPSSLIAYVGLVKLGPQNHRLFEKQCHIKAERVAAQGRKLSFEQARAYFPALKKAQYRRP